LLFPDILVLI